MNNEVGAENFMSAASALARRHNAHLIGMHTIEVVYPGIAIHIPDIVYEAYGTSQIEQSAALNEVFERHAMRNISCPNGACFTAITPIFYG